MASQKTSIWRGLSKLHGIQFKVEHITESDTYLEEKDLLNSMRDRIVEILKGEAYRKHAPPSLQ